MLENYGLISTNLLVQVVEEEKTQGGIILQGRSFEDGTPFVKAIVVKTGPGRLLNSGERLPVCVTPGDEIFLFGNSNMTLDIEGEFYTLASEDMIVYYKKGDLNEYLAKKAEKKAEAERVSKEVAPLMNPRGYVPLSSGDKIDVPLKNEKPLSFEQGG